MDSALYFNCGYIVEEDKEDIYKIVGVKVVNALGEVEDVTIAEFNSILADRDDARFTGKLNEFDKITPEIRIVRAKNLHKLHKAFDVDYSKYSRFKPNNSFLLVNLDKLNSMRKSSMTIPTVAVNIYNVGGKTLYKNNSLRVFTIDDPYSNDVECDVKAWFIENKLVYKLASYGIYEDSNNEYLGYSFEFENGKVSRIVDYTYYNDAVIVKDSLFEDCGVLVRYNEYCLLNYKKSNVESVILPCSCEYLVRSCVVYPEATKLVINPQFKRYSCISLDYNKAWIFECMPKLSEIYLSSSLDLDSLANILSSLLLGHTYSNNYTYNCLIDGMDNQVDIDKLNNNFNNILKKECKEEGIKFKSVNISLY